MSARFDAEAADRLADATFDDETTALPCHGDLLRRLANATREERIAWWRTVKAAA
jgi:hypothetical protein